MLLAGRYHFATPGTIPDWFAFGLSLLFITVIFTADVLTSANVRLHVLYVFPLSATAYHCERKWLSFVLLGIAFAAQTLTAINEGLPRVTFVSDLAIVFATSMLIIFMSRAARINHLLVLKQASTDALTQLANRGAAIVAIGNEIARQRRYGGLFSLAELDLDGFKKLNDTQGHSAGDDALLLLADTLRRNTRGSDVVARLGGDEFVVLMPSMHSEDCHSFCEKLCETIRIRMAEAGFDITSSIGWKTFSLPPESTLEALQHVDALMYEAKRSGRGYASSLEG